MSDIIFDKDVRANVKAHIARNTASLAMEYIESLEAVACAAKAFWGNTTDKNADILYDTLSKVGWMEEE